MRPDVVETGRYSEVRAGAVIGLWGFRGRCCCRTRRGVRGLSSDPAAATTQEVQVRKRTPAGYPGEGAQASTPGYGGRRAAGLHARAEGGWRALTRWAVHEELMFLQKPQVSAPG